MEFLKLHKLLFSIIFVGFFLRIFWIFNSPPSLYWDEVSLGYNSFSISQTFRDEHGKLLPLQAFTAFGDYKPPLYIYLTVPLVKIFGLNYLTVRFVSILSGSLLIFVAFLLAKKILPKNKKYPYIVSVLVAISPWSIQLSRAAFEANLGALLSATGTLFFLKSAKNPKLYIISILFFVLAMYSYNGTRYFLPFWIVALVIWQLVSSGLTNKISRYLVVSFVVGAILVIPLIQFGLTDSGRLRFNEVNIFSDPQPVIKSNLLQAENNNSFISKIIYNRRVFYTQNFFKHYFDHYSFNYLFLTGDINPRFSSQSMGQLYLVEILLIPFGAIYLFRRKRKYFYLILLWVILSPIPASIARETPHALRTLHILPSIMLLSAAGIISLLNILNKKIIKKIYLLLICTLFIVQFGYFYSNYLLTYPIKYGDEWQDGYRQLAEEVLIVKDKYSKIIMTDYYGRAYINMLYYWQYDSNKYLLNRDAFSEPSGLWTVKGFDNLSFKPNVTCTDSDLANLIIGIPSDFYGIPAQKVIFDSVGKAKFVMINSNDCKK